jgi:NADH dehydrogenase
VPTSFRRAAIGLLAGLIASVALVATVGNPALGIFLGGLVGIGLGLLFRRAEHSYLEAGVTAAALGVLLWVGWSVLALPLLMGVSPQWTATAMRVLFPELVGWVLYGAMLGLLEQVLSDVAIRVFGPEATANQAIDGRKTRIVVLGGGFAGLTAAQRLERAFAEDPSVELTLVSDTNALLFTPMLAEVAASSLEATHISTPLRTTVRQTDVIRASVMQIDVERKTVRLAPDIAGNQERDLEYDHLVLALGAISNYLGNDSVKAEAFDFKSLTDAIRIRNHVIDVFERAERETDPNLRKALLTFVIAGGGFAGAELAGGLNDFARGMLAIYPNIATDDLRVILVHSRDRILPELSESLARYALTHMAQRGVTFKLNTRVAGARRGVVALTPSEEIRTETLVWTAGTAPNPLIKTMAVDVDRRGAVVVDGYLRVPGRAGVWALGDCAAVPDVKPGTTCPPTAQFALREAKTLAHNIAATLHDRPLKTFHFNALGALCVVGHHTACAEIKGLRFSGLFAWFLWRTIYLSKLPGLERKLHVVSDWTIELFFPRDIVQTIDFSHEQR